VRYAILGFALGVILAGVIFWGVYSTTTADAERRLDESIRRGGVLLAEAEAELGRQKLTNRLLTEALERANGRIGTYQKRLEASDTELERLRSLQNQDGIAIDGSLEGIERIRAIIEGLPILE